MRLYSPATDMKQTPSFTNAHAEDIVRQTSSRDHLWEHSSRSALPHPSNSDDEASSCSESPPKSSEAYFIQFEGPDEHKPSVTSDNCVDEDVVTVNGKPATKYLCEEGDKSSERSRLFTGHPPRVRFRSRVRITSGISRHRSHNQSCSIAAQTQDYFSLPPSSTASSSPASSISVPLRTKADEEIGKPGWGTLGQRVSLLARGRYPRKSREERERERFAKGLQRRDSLGDRLYANERTPLLASPLRKVTHGSIESADNDSAQLQGQASYHEREVARIFGPWPERLYNHHWWWWKMEPIVCCWCLTDLDEECY
ncbi:hypothetical protein CPB83DRAFT_842355 [Crepidotus variabilis]|uniref:Uncharacterized protein n=1 Tax=Crepidotus variabilis TaxID=179855 RepID=A0A9P6EVK7_9AGAR|nr:hypothetical protein CPB83DRAFT_842355 [Crepidotus variabilis]